MAQQTKYMKDRKAKADMSSSISTYSGNWKIVSTEEKKKMYTSK